MPTRIRPDSWDATKTYHVVHIVAEGAKLPRRLSADDFLSGIFHLRVRTPRAVTAILVLRI